MEIITGYTGTKHITADQDRDINIGVAGAKSYVLNNGIKMKAEISSNNEIKIRDGILFHQGCAASIKKNTYDSIIFSNGSQGMNRIDLIVARYEKNNDTRIESLDFKVIQGTPSESNPVVPEHIEGDIQAGDSISDMPMYEVRFEGLNIVEVKPLFNVLASMEELQSEVAELNSNLTNHIDEISKKLGITILHDSDYPYYQLSILGRAYTKDNATTYGFTIKYGNSTVGKWSGDTYYISVSHDGKMLVGVQINSAARPTWYEK